MSRPALLQLGSWPGRGEPPKAPRTRGRLERLGERPALVLVAAAERGAVPENFGLAAALEVLGPSVLRAWLVVADDLDASTRRRLATWARRQQIATPAGPRPLELATLRQFFAYKAGPFTTTSYAGAGALVGADLGRTLGLVAEAWAPGRGFWRGGWRIWLPSWSEVRSDENGRIRRRGASPHRPALHVEAAGPHGILASFDRCPPGMGKRAPGGAAWRGRFVDVIAAAHALDGLDSGDLGDHLEARGIPRLEVPAAATIDPAGARELLDLVKAVHALALALDDEAARWSSPARPLDLARLYSPATIGTHLLEAAGVEAPLAKFPVPGDAALDRWQAASHGGWQTAELAGAGIFPAADIDLRSAYPACASLLDWWAVVTAAELAEEDVTADLLDLCERAARGALSPLLDRSTWRRFGLTLAELLPEGDELPVDVLDDEHPQGGLSWRPVRSEVPLPFAWPHVVLAAVRTGRVPRILSATRLVPVSRQPGLRRLPLLDGTSLPPGEDPVPVLARRRQLAKDQGDDVLGGQLRVLVNASTYGTSARLDEVPDRVFEPAGAGRKPRVRIVGSTERPSRYTFPPVAATVSAGSALLVGVAERLLVEAGGTVAGRDTDGLLVVASPEGGEVALHGGAAAQGAASLGRSVPAVAWDALSGVLARFDRLDPFGDGRPAWKVRRAHHGRPLHALVISRKRYATFTLDEDGSLAELVDATEHALAVVEPPPSRRELRPDGRHAWSLDVARRVVGDQLAREAGGEASTHPFTWDGTPALLRLQLGTPDALDEAPPSLGCRPFSRVLRPLLDRRAGEEAAPPWLLDPSGDLAGALDSPGWRDNGRAAAPAAASHGRPVRLTTRADLPGLLVDTLEGRAHRWSSPRPWPEPAELVVRRSTIRRVGRLGPALDAAATGEEGAGEGARLVVAEADLPAEATAIARQLGPTALARATTVPLRTARRLASGLSLPREETVEAALAAEVPEPRRCEAGSLCRHAAGDLGRILTGRQARWCGDPCQKVASRRARGIGAPHGRPAGVRRSASLRTVGVPAPRRHRPPKAEVVGADVGCFACGELPAPGRAWRAGFCNPCQAEEDSYR